MRIQGESLQDDGGSTTLGDVLVRTLKRALGVEYETFATHRTEAEAQLRSASGPFDEQRLRRQWEAKISLYGLNRCVHTANV